MTLRIAGAGLAGLLAAHAWPQAAVFEASSEPRAHHKALLRFRSDAVARLIGIDFKAVTVRKGIWIDGGFVPPSIRVANMYSKKVLGSLEADRSIWNIDPVERFIAPENLYEQMIEAVGPRIRWGTPFDFADQSQCPGAPLINTAPLPIVLNALAEHLKVTDPAPIDFRRAPIKVQRFRVPKAAVYQTIYFPQPGMPIYRASITGDLLIVESMADAQINEWHLQDNVVPAFSLDHLERLETVEQKYGKIAPLDPSVRKALLHRLTVKHGIFSLGRFATWRNVLLDDVVDDITVIRKLLRSSEYEHRLHFSS